MQKSESESILKKDIERTFPTHKIFRLKEGAGQKALYNILKVYSIIDPEVGYCQGMSFICAMLICYMDEIDAFWCLTAILKGFNLRELFLQELPLLKQYIYRFSQLLEAYMPDLASHLVFIFFILLI